MRAQRRLLLSIAALALVSGCAGFTLGSGTTTIGSAPYEEGSGTVANDTRTLEPFNAVSAAEGVQVELAAGDPSATVTADDNLLAHISTVVSNGVLAIDVSGSLRTSHPLRVVVHSPVLPDRLTASTGASIEARAVSGGSLRVEASTGAHVHCAGTADVLSVSASTGGSADLRDLRTTDARVDASTGSSIHVQANGSVTGSSTGGSSIHVHGGGSLEGIQKDASSSVDRG
jgi:hypothetical protein